MKNLATLSLAAAILSTTAFAGDPNGVCTPAEEALGHCFQTSPGFVVEIIPGINGEFPVIDAFGNSVFSYLISGPSSGGGSCQGIHDVSHGSLMIPACTSNSLVILDSNPTVEHQTNGQGDPSCGFGLGNTSVEIVKWDVGVPCDDKATFSVTFAGIVGSGLTQFQLKDSGNCRTGMILGPNCDPPPVVPYCIGTSNCPCGNNTSGGDGGCANSLGVGAILTTSGSTSVAADDLVLQASNLPPNELGIFLMARDVGPVMNNLQSGLLCLGGPQNKIVRILPLSISSPQGTASTSPGLVALSCSGAIADPAISCITPGSSFNFQLYYRDPSPNAPCGGFANLTNALRITFSN